MTVILVYIGFSLWFLAGYKVGEYRTRKEYIKKRSD